MGFLPQQQRRFLRQLAHHQPNNSLSHSGKDRVFVADVPYKRVADLPINLPQPKTNRGTLPKFCGNLQPEIRRMKV
jgi:hypothetical protein